MSYPMITAMTAVVFTVLQVILMMRVGLMRGEVSVPLGDGGKEMLLRRIRVHGNLTENLPLFLILLGLIEVQVGGSMVVKSFAVFFFAIRISHVIGMNGPESPKNARVIGALGTVISLFGTGGYLTYLTLFAS